MSVDTHWRRYDFQVNRGRAALLGRCAHGRRPRGWRRGRDLSCELTAVTFLILFAAADWFIALAAGTSGYPDDKDDALVLAGLVYCSS